jgi:hypothetical protein
MTRNYLAAWTASAIACLSVSQVWAQSAATSNPGTVPSQAAAAPQSNVKPPDACKL